MEVDWRGRAYRSYRFFHAKKIVHIRRNLGQNTVKVGCCLAYVTSPHSIPGDWFPVWCKMLFFVVCLL